MVCILVGEQEIGDLVQFGSRLGGEHDPAPIEHLGRVVLKRGTCPRRTSVLDGVGQFHKIIHRFKAL
ncbi:Protein of unknown function [Propionibacterium freudenreichii]|nr:Protein of unknown function [Propionibacterium freudenreichii]CEI49597.1 Protein of unknown function [Propionibacterium freudenreichii]